MPGEMPMGGDDRTSADGRLRVSNAERQAVVDALRLHTTDGRLGIDEFEERSGQALAARTRDDLKGLLADLPSEPGYDGPATMWAGAVPVQEPAPPPHPARPAYEGAIAGQGAAHHHGGTHDHPRDHGHHHGWSGFVYLSLLLTAIWFMAGAGYFWPMWVIVPIGLGVVCSGGRSSRRRIGPTPPGAS